MRGALLPWMRPADRLPWCAASAHTPSGRLRRSDEVRHGDDPVDRLLWHARPRECRRLLHLVQMPRPAWSELSTAATNRPGVIEGGRAGSPRSFWWERRSLEEVCTVLHDPMAVYSNRHLPMGVQFAPSRDLVAFRRSLLIFF